jgi:cation diffusion facilitator CzcD-associated flavoprotein CzcO
MDNTPKRIAVVGAGSSGLITLKYVLDSFPESEVVCFEKGFTVHGCWGNLGPEFISTSTKYATQFSCFPVYDATLSEPSEFTEFYRGGEFGAYLERFADQFGLKKHIQFGSSLTAVRRIEDQWELAIERFGEPSLHHFDTLFLCTGLVNEPRPIDASETTATVTADYKEICGKKVVVIGGGESAVEIARTLAEPQRNNRVYLSLRSGIRVSPRYHPIKGVPSDYLRNRLMLSIHENIRNWVGDRFVSFRIRYSGLLRLLFPATQGISSLEREKQKVKKHWELKLKARAKGELFNMFHNKSDLFLEAVADGRIQIIGPSTDTRHTNFLDFDQQQSIEIDPEVVVPSTGYRSKLPEISNGEISLKDFYLGCAHAKYHNLMLVGFARPIIGNIPSISEMQAKYTVGLLAGKWSIPKKVGAIQESCHLKTKKRFPALDTDSIYPVDHLPYCDELAKKMGSYPSPFRVRSLTTWLKIKLTPASPLHYVDEQFDRERIEKQPIYSPRLLTAFLLSVKLFDLPYQILDRVRSWMNDRTQPSPQSSMREREPLSSSY